MFYTLSIIAQSYKENIYDETGFYYLQSRYYDPSIRLFISADDRSIIGTLSQTAGEINLYAYCGNNPVMYTDPSGYMPDWAWKLVVGTAFILAGAFVAAATTGIGVGFGAAFGSALFSSAIQVGASVAVGICVNGLSNLANGNEFFDNVVETIASSYMWGGVFSGGSQILSGGFRFLRAKTGFKGLDTSKVGLLSADKLYYQKPGMTLIRVGSRNSAKLAIDFGRYGIHAHIFSNLHTPVIPFFVGLIEIL